MNLGLGVINFVILGGAEIVKFVINEILRSLYFTLQMVVQVFHIWLYCLPGGANLLDYKICLRRAKLLLNEMLDCRFTGLSLVFTDSNLGNEVLDSVLLQTVEPESAQLQLILILVKFDSLSRV